VTIRGIGIDVADIERFRRLVARGGERFVEKWFAPAEIDRCSRHTDPGAAYAEHYAAKEAVWKALGPRAWDGPLPWRSIIVMGEQGDVVLEGRAAHLAGDTASMTVRVSVARLGEVVIATSTISD